MRLLLAVRVFFRILLDRAAAQRIQDALQADSAASASASASARPTPRRTARPTGRSDALTLLAALQREARFVDFIQESLEEFSDAQIGAAARDVHRDCQEVIERMFGIVPASTESEGAEIEVARGYDPGCWKLTGNPEGEPPFRGPLAHHGWKATRCQLPEWSGSKAAERVLAPVEVEVK
jgi:hypothetical protein